MDSLERVKALVSKLLRMTAANGCTLNEAAIAAERAQELIARYTLDVASLTVEGDPAVDVQNIFDAMGRRCAWGSWRQTLLTACAAANNCRAWHVNTYPPRYCVAGTEHGRALTVYLWVALMRLVDGMGQAYVRNHARGQRGARRMGRAFRFGVAVAVRDRLREAALAAELNPATQERALVRVRSERRTVNDWVEKHVGAMQKKHLPRMDPAAYASGYAAGKVVALPGKAIHGSEPTGRRLLS